MTLPPEVWLRGPIDGIQPLLQPAAHTHLPGSLDRPELGRLLARFAAGLEAAIEYLRTVSPDSLLLPREVGRKRLPSTTLGLIVHAAEHSSRHAGQIVTLTRVVRG
jgi:uncharacterized damage-inducible protein DinB